MFRCKCGTDFKDPLEAAECEQAGHNPNPDPIVIAERLIHITMGTPVTGGPRGGFISEAALLARSLSDQTLLTSVRQILATEPPIPFRDLIAELVRRLNNALEELATHADNRP